MGFGSPSMPAAPAVVAPPPLPPSIANTTAQQAGSDARKRAAMAQGFGGTILTGGDGLTAPATTTVAKLGGS